MEILSPVFFVFAVVAILSIRLVEGSRLRPWVLLAFSAGFILSLAPDQPQRLLPLVVFLGLSWGLTRLVAARPSGATLACAITLVLTTFIWLKQYQFARFLPPLGFPYVEVGLSYILFRVIQVLTDTAAGSLRPAVGLPAFLNFTCFFPAFVSGPVQRYQDFAEQSASPEPVGDHGAVLAQVGRILWGIVKVSLLSAALWDYLQEHSFALRSGKLIGDWGLSLRWYAYNCFIYTVYVYFNFSGYTDIVLGIGRLMGFRLPENFNRPYLAVNYIDLWARWHMSVSNWFKVHIFNPVVTALTRRWPNPALAPYYGVAGFFVTFFFVGIWHVPTLTLGFALALGISVNKLYETILRRRLGAKRHKALVARPAYRHAARGLALGYFAVSLTAMWLAPSELRALFGKQGQYLAMGAATLVLATVIALVSAVGGLLAGLAAMSFPRPDRLLPWWGQAFALGVGGFAVWLLILMAQRQVPDFLYKGF